MLKYVLNAKLDFFRVFFLFIFCSQSKVTSVIKIIIMLLTKYQLPRNANI